MLLLLLLSAPPPLPAQRRAPSHVEPAANKVPPVRLKGGRHRRSPHSRDEVPSSRTPPPHRTAPHRTAPHLDEPPCWCSRPLLSVGRALLNTESKDYQATSRAPSPFKLKSQSSRATGVFRKKTDEEDQERLQRLQEEKEKDEPVLTDSDFTKLRVVCLRAEKLTAMDKRWGGELTSDPYLRLHVELRKREVKSDKEKHKHHLDWSKVIDRRPKPLQASIAPQTAPTPTPILTPTPIPTPTPPRSQAAKLADLQVKDLGFIQGEPQRTRACNSTLNPEWKEELLFDIPVQ